MKWRTDKPTADLIVAQVGYAEEFYYEILTRLPNGEYRGEYDTQPLHHILKWADLKEDEKPSVKLPKWKIAERTVRFIGEPQFLIKTMQDGGDHSDYEVVNVSDTILKGDKYIDLDDILNMGEDETVTDCDELKEEVISYFQGCWPGTETAEQCNADMRFTPLAIMRLAEHFAKWGAEHLKK